MEVKQNGKRLGMLLGVRAACAELNCGPTAFYLLAKRRKFEVVKLGRRTLVRTHSLMQFISSLPDRDGPESVHSTAASVGGDGHK